jgi:hypothetical protein
MLALFPGSMGRATSDFPRVVPSRDALPMGTSGEVFLIVTRPLGGKRSSGFVRLLEISKLQLKTERPAAIMSAIPAIIERVRFFRRAEKFIWPPSLTTSSVEINYRPYLNKKQGYL